MKDIDHLVQQAKASISAADDIPALEQLRVNYLGKKGALTLVLKELGALSAEERPLVGARVNEAKRELNGCIEERINLFKTQALEKKLATESIDLSLPGRRREYGSFHPVTQIKQKISDFFSPLGFDIVEGPEVETEFYNFEALNIPANHPARAMHDTFYLSPAHLLRTHTSPVQIRMMENREPPFRLIAPGRVYRCDSDLTHTPMFHQVEGLLIDKAVNLAGLKGLLQSFFADLFGFDISLRFRPSYFPFTEPSAEGDIQCTQCRGKGCRICKGTGWLEVFGCGMVHPNVLAAVNIDSAYQGWAFGMGIDRLAMLYFGIDDLRLLFENEIDFLKQF